jgi:phosphate transport system protein
VRVVYLEELEAIRASLVELATSVGAAMSSATTALLDADIASADLVIGGDAQINDARDDIEDRCFTLLVRQQPVATDLRTVTAAMRIADDLERMGDLAVHVAKLARMRFPDHAAPEPMQLLFREVGRVAGRLTAHTVEVIARPDAEAAARLATEDDRMDALHRQLLRDLLSVDGPGAITAAIDVTLLGRFYERYADHAVNVARRVTYLVTGQRDSRVKAAGQG